MSDQPRKFRRLSFNGDRLEADIGPGVPRAAIEPLDLPAAEPAKTERCWLCLGCGEMLDDCSEPIACDLCQGTGQIGGQS